MEYLRSIDKTDWQPVGFDKLERDVKQFANDYDSIMSRLEDGQVIKIIDRYYKKEPDWIKQSS